MPLTIFTEFLERADAAVGPEGLRAGTRRPAGLQVKYVGDSGADLRFLLERWADKHDYVELYRPDQRVMRAP